MGILERGERRVHLRERHLIGRSRICALRLTEQRASGEHAILTWSDGCWRLRDLGSRNGTWVGSTQLKPSTSRALTDGAVLAFGARQQTWVLTSAEGPVPFATGPDGRSAAAEGGLLDLPTTGAPMTIHRLGSGVWVADGPTGLTLVEDLQDIEVDGVIWRLNLPEGLPRTEVDDRPTAAELKLRFRVNRTEEHIELVALARGRTIDLGSRAHHALLLNLARVRREDAADADLAPAERGWVDKDRIARMLGEDDNIVHTYIHRARKQLARAGVLDAAELIERRLGSRELRLGPTRIEIDAL